MMNNANEKIQHSPRILLFLNRISEVQQRLAKSSINCQLIDLTYYRIYRDLGCKMLSIITKADFERYCRDCFVKIVALPDDHFLYLGFTKCGWKYVVTTEENFISSWEEDYKKYNNLDEFIMIYEAQLLKRTFKYCKK